MVCFHAEGLVAGLLSAQTEEIANERAAVGSIHPLAGSPPLELRGFRSLVEGFAGGAVREVVEIEVGDVVSG